MTWGFRAGLVTLKDSKDGDPVMSSRLILKTKAHQPQYAIHFNPFSCFKHCNICINGILIFEALKKKIYGCDLRSDGVSVRFSKQKICAKWLYLYYISWHFCLNRVTRKVESVPAASRPEVGCTLTQSPAHRRAAIQNQQPFTHLIRSISFEFIWTLTHLGRLSLGQLLMIGLIAVLWVFIACGQQTCHMIRHLTKMFLCKESENK